MEIETLKKDAKKSVIENLNRAVQVEYGFIFNYPRVIEKLANINKNGKLDDTIEAIETLVRESLRHFSKADSLIVRLGGETQWSLEVMGELVNVEEELSKQLEKEKWGISWYTSVKRIAEQNKVKAGGFLSRLTGNSGILPEDFIDANEIINTMGSLIRDEKRHVTLVKNSIDTLKKLMNK